MDVCNADSAIRTRVSIITRSALITDHLKARWNGSATARYFYRMHCTPGRYCSISMYRVINRQVRERGGSEGAAAEEGRKSAGIRS